jgi:RimJ/RimL family protein N-acetyltransferase
MLRGETIVLRAPVPEDKDCLSRLRNDVPLQTALMALPRAGSPRRVDEWVEGVLGDPQSLFYVVAELVTNRCLGFIQLRKMDFVHGTGELGICLDAPARGKSAAVQAIALLEGHARDVFGLRKVLLQVLASNERAVACYRKCRYREVGVLKEQFYHAGAHHDALIMEHLLEGRA